MEFFDKNFYRSNKRHSLTKQDISKQIKKRLRCSAPEAKQLVEDTIEIIKSTLENEEDVMISNFGKFCVREKKERLGRNPSKGKSMKLRKRRVVTFSAAGNLRDRINNPALKYNPNRPYGEKI